MTEFGSSTLSFKKSECAITLAPGWHFGYFVWKYKVIKQNIPVIPQGEMGLILANDGTAIPSERFLGKVVDCDTFQSARKFLLNGGEKGRQLGILTARMISEPRPSS